MSRAIILVFLAGFLSLSTNGQTPYLVKDLNPGTESGIQWITDFVCSDGLYFFIGMDDTQGNELCVSDGTEAGTFVVKDINPDNTNMQNVNDPFPFNGGVLFGGDDGVNGKEPWFSDGTEAGTFMLADIQTGANSSIVNGNWAEINGKVVFTAFYGQSGQELCVTDGTTAGTGLLKELSIGGISNSGVVGVSWGAGFFKFQDNLYFLGNDGTNDWELWKTDGTTAGTVRVKDINPGSNSGMDDSFNIDNFYEFGNELYFVADDGTNGVEVWKTDGTDAGTMMLSDINTTGDAFTSGAGYPYFFEFNSKLYFVADNGSNGKEIWSTDGTDLGTSMLKDINFGGDGIVVPGFINYQGELLFGAEDFSSGTELWKTDGTELGTVEVAEINPGNGDGVLKPKVNFNGFVYFIGVSDDDGAELYRTDGTAAGTIMVKDVYPGNGHGIYQNEGLHVANDLLYYKGASPDTGQELWQSDGTEAGTICAGEIEPGTGHGSPQNLSLKCQNLYFTGNTTAEGNELWALNTGWIVGDEEIEKEDNFLRIYPNPSNGEFKVDLGSTQEAAHLMIMDMNMKVVYQEQISNQSLISINQNLRSGSYILMVNDGSENRIQKLQIF